MATLGLIFSATHCQSSLTITKNRTIASVPVGGRYRLIDFTLSNMVNDGVNHIGLVTTTNYQSLIDHIESAKEWDLARKHGGLTLLPPYTNKPSKDNNRLESLRNIIDFIRRAPEEYVILTDSYHMCNIQYEPVFKELFNKKADIVCVYRKVDLSKHDYTPVKTLTLANDGRVIELNFEEELKGKVNMSLDIWVMRKDLLVSLVEMAIKADLHSFNRDILSNHLDKYRVYGYEFKGYFNEVTSLKSYFDLNMDLLNMDVRSELFWTDNRPIYTKVRDSAPTKYITGCKVSKSTIADGCIIEGTVENSVIFRGVTVKKGAVVKDCVLMQDTVVEEDAYLQYVVTDKNVTVTNGTKIRGTHENIKYIKKFEVI